MFSKQQQLIALILCITSCIIGAPRVTLTGFIRSDASLVTRQMFFLDGSTSAPAIPFERLTNKFGQDIYSHWGAAVAGVIPSLELLVDNIRIGSADVQAFFNANMPGFEVGSGYIMVTHAFTLFKWPNLSIAVGQLQHPLMPPDVYPNTVAANLAFAIEPFAFNPQIRSEFLVYNDQECAVTVEATLYGEYLYANPGPGLFGPLVLPWGSVFTASFSNQYQRSSIIPNTALRAEYSTQNYRIGMILDAAHIKPRLMTKVEHAPLVLPEEYQGYTAVGEYLNSGRLSLYSSVSLPNCLIHAQGTFGGNGAPLNTFGGYGVSNIESTTDLRHYTNINFGTIWGDVTCTRWKKIQPGLMIGYGTTTESNQQLAIANDDFLNAQGRQVIIYTADNPFDLAGTIVNPDELPVAFNKNILKTVRVSPRVWIYLTNNVLLGLEANIYHSLFAIPSRQATPIKTTKSWVNNLFAIASMQYLF